MQLVLIGLPPDDVNALCDVLSGPLTWMPRHPKDLPAGLSMWEAHSQEWHVVLADFDVASQTGRAPGDRGQNLIVSSKTAMFPQGLKGEYDADFPPGIKIGSIKLAGVPGAPGLSIMGDSIMQHETARWLLERMSQGGAGKSKMTCKLPK